MNSAGFNFFKRFSAKFVNLSAKFGSLNVQIRNNFKNNIFIACKRSKTFKYYVNTMVILCSTCQKEEKESTWVKYLIYAVLLPFPIYRNSCVFSAKSVFLKFQSSQKKNPSRTTTWIWVDCARCGSELGGNTQKPLAIRGKTPYLEAGRKIFGRLRSIWPCPSHFEIGQETGQS